MIIVFLLNFTSQDVAVIFGNVFCRLYF
jgi:hypothetical protein